MSFNKKEGLLLLNYMKENNIKIKTEAIRKCSKKLLEQFFANMFFKKNYDVKEYKNLNKFYQEITSIAVKLWINIIENFLHTDL